jgi:hypothetical protein
MFRKKSRKDAFIETFDLIYQEGAKVCYLFPDGWLKSGCPPK